MHRHNNKIVTISTRELAEAPGGPAADASTDFISVDIKSLSYAEVSALNTAATDKPDKADKQAVRVVDQADLEASISEYQMAETLGAGPSRVVSSVHYGPEQHDEAGDDGPEQFLMSDSTHDLLFNDKRTKTAKKCKKMKRKH